MNYDEFLNETAREMKPSGIRKFFDVVKEIKGAISLGVGEPDFITPWSIRDAAIRSIQKGRTQYTSNSGMKELREAIVQYLKERFSLEYDYTNVLVTIGASEAIDLVFRACLSPGDEVLIPDPSYVSYAPCVALSGGVPVSVHCSMQDAFKLTPEQLEACITPKTKIVILPYPNNPTGGVMERPFLEAIAPVIQKHNLLVLSDEIYAELTYGSERHVSIAEVEGMKERTVVINGFSKSFAMTGWRLGYLAGPEPLVRAMTKIHQYTIMCASTASQYAALNALESSFEDGFEMVSEMRRQYDMRRRYLVNEFNGMGLETFEPRGAFYVFPKVSSLGMDGTEFAERLLADQKVAVVPGSAFGESGKDFVRVSYAYSLQNLERAMARIHKFVEGLK